MSIAVPIYNEGRFLRGALHSLLEQDYGNFEIVISDNASTDDTEQICREYAGKDSRIRYYRFDVNQGAVANFKRAMDEARGEYFMWASGHDQWSPNLVSECIKLLQREPAAVLAFGSSTWMDTSGESIAKKSGWTDTRGLDAVGRFFAVFWGNMHPILGVMRLEKLRQARFLSCVGTDLLLLSQLVLMGDFVHATSASWVRRQFRTAETHKDRMARYGNAQYGLSRSIVARFFPLARLPLELVRAVWCSRVSGLEKFGIITILVPAFPLRYLLGRRGRVRPVPAPR